MKLVQSPIPFESSKWVYLPFLVEPEELEDLFIRFLPAIKMYNVSQVVKEGGGVEDAELFLSHYRRYINLLKAGEVPPASQFRGLFSQIWSCSEETVYALDVGEGRRLIKPQRAGLQCRLNQMRYSSEEGRFLTQTFAADTICWGIQIGFPHLYIDPKTHAVCTTKEEANAPLFHGVQKWLRAATLPTPFLIGEKRINASIRLGKGCFEWINDHPQLKAQGIRVLVQ